MADPLSPAAAPVTGADFLAPAPVARSEAGRAAAVPASGQGVAESFDAHLQRARRLQRVPVTGGLEEGATMPPAGGMVLPSALVAAAVVPEDAVAEAAPLQPEPAAAVAPRGVVPFPAAQESVAEQPEVWSFDQDRAAAGEPPGADAQARRPARAGADVVPVEATAVALASRAAAGPWAVPAPARQADPQPQVAQSPEAVAAQGPSPQAPEGPQAAFSARRQGTEPPSAAQESVAEQPEVWSFDQDRAVAGESPRADAPARRPARAGADVVPVEATAVALASRAAAGPWAVPAPARQADPQPQVAQSPEAVAAQGPSPQAPEGPQAAFSDRLQGTEPPSAAQEAASRRAAQAESAPVLPDARLRDEVVARGDGPPADRLVRAAPADLAAPARVLTARGVDTARQPQAFIDPETARAPVDPVDAPTAAGQTSPQPTVQADHAPVGVSSPLQQAPAMAGPAPAAGPLETSRADASRPTVPTLPRTSAPREEAGGDRSAALEARAMAAVRFEAGRQVPSTARSEAETSSPEAGASSAQPGAPSGPAVAGGPLAAGLSRAQATVGVPATARGDQAVPSNARAASVEARPGMSRPGWATPQASEPGATASVDGRRQASVSAPGSAAPSWFPAQVREGSSAAADATLPIPGQAAPGRQPFAGLTAQAGRWTQALDTQASRMEQAPGLEQAGPAARADAATLAPRAVDGAVTAAASGPIRGDTAVDTWQNARGAAFPGPRFADALAITGEAALPPRAAGAAQAAKSPRVAALDPGRPLQFAPLGPGIDLMVGPEPEPAMQDLLEFARASGIGADALERLFGPQASTGSRTGSAAPQASVPLPGGSASPMAAPPWLAVVSGVDARQEAPPARLQVGTPDEDGIDSLPASAPTDRSHVSPPSALSAASVPSSPAAAAAPAHALAGAAVPPVSYAEMSHRVAQAVASRMVAGLREGSGSLRLQLEPQSLGRVEVQMALQDGRLEATIAAHQAGTRDLLNDGIVRLRETLGQLGMNVAVITVVDGSGGRGDGKPTRQRPGDAAYTRQATGQAGVEGALEGVRPSRGVSGLDVWA